MEIAVILIGAILAVGVGFWLLLFGFVFLVEIAWQIILLPVRIVWFIGAVLKAIADMLQGYRRRS